MARAHSQDVRHVVALHDPEQGLTGPFHELGAPGTSWETAGWVGDRLMIVHGHTTPLVTVLT